jgi:hypothetical protein
MKKNLSLVSCTAIFSLGYGVLSLLLGADPIFDLFPAWGLAVSIYLTVPMGKPE